MAAPDESLGERHFETRPILHVALMAFGVVVAGWAGWMASGRASPMAVAQGLLFVAAGVAFAIRGWWLLLRAGPVLSVTPEGIRYRPLGDLVIPWTAIAAVTRSGDPPSSRIELRLSREFADRLRLRTDDRAILPAWSFDVGETDLVKLFGQYRRRQR